MAGSKLTASLTLGIKANLGGANRYLQTIQKIDKAQAALVSGGTTRGGVKLESSAMAKRTAAVRRSANTEKNVRQAAAQSVWKTQMSNIVREERARKTATVREERDRVRSVQRAAKAEQRARQRAQNNVARSWNREQARKQRVEAKSASRGGKRGAFGLFDRRRTPGGGMHLAANAAQVSAGAGRIARGAFSAVSVPLQAAREQGRSIAEIGTLLDDSTDISMKSADAVTRSAALEYGNDAQSQAKAYYDIISAGAGSASAADALLAESNRLAIAGNAELGASADGLTSLLNAYGLEGTEASRATASLMAAVKAGKTTIPELATSIGRIAPSANALGISMEELNAAIATTTKQGIDTNESVSGLKGAFANIKKPSKEAREEAKRLGIEFNETALRTKGLDQFMREMVNAEGFEPESYTKLFGSIRGGNAVIALTAGNMERFGEALADQADGAETAAAAVQKMMDTDDRKIRRAEAAIADLKIELGQGLAPAALDVVKQVTPLVRDLAKFAKENPGTITTIAKATIAIGVLAVGIKVASDAVLVFNAGMSAAKVVFPLVKSGAELAASGIKTLATETAAGQAATKALGTNLSDISTKGGKAGAAVGVLAAAVAGYTIGQQLDDTFKWSDALADVAANATFAADELITLQNIRDAQSQKQLEHQRRKLRQEQASQDKAFQAASTLGGFVGGLGVKGLDQFTGRKAERAAALASVEGRIGEEDARNRALKKAGVDPTDKRAVAEFGRKQREAFGVGKASPGDSGPGGSKVEGNLEHTIKIEGLPDGASAVVTKTKDDTGMFQNRGTASG